MKKLFASIFFLFILVLVVLLLWPDESFEDRCQKITEFDYQMICYIEETLDIIDRKGIQGGFDYVDDVVWPHTNFGVTHMVAHEIGHTAWLETEDLQEALSLLPYKDFTWEEFWKYEGFMHGVLHLYFLDEWEGKPVTDLLAYCPYDDIVFLNPLGDMQKLKLEVCSHAIGHGVMVGTSYNTTRSLSYCDDFSSRLERLECYSGVFMELSFLQNPLYGVYGDPTNRNISFSDLCEPLSIDQKEVCSRFVAWSSFAAGNTPDESFALCHELENQMLKERCVFTASFHFMPLLYGTAYSEMATFCNGLRGYDPIMEYACIAGTSFGIKIGGTGDILGYEQFCEHFEGDLRRICLESN